MCIAIPYGKEKTNESRLWQILRTRPFYLLSLGALIQSLLLLIFYLSLHYGLINSHSLITSPAIIYSYGLLFAISSFIMLALGMHFYPKKIHSTDFEYLYYGSFFFLANYTSAFFYLASFYSTNLLMAFMMFHFGLLLFAFKPLWRAGFWAEKKYKKLAYTFNAIFFSLILSQCLVLIWLLKTI